MKKISILGIGKSGVAAAYLAKKNGYIPFLSDRAVCRKLGIYIENLVKKNIDFECGKHSLFRIMDCEEVVLSPGISKESDLVRKLAKKKNIISEVEFAYRYTEQPLIGITGSNGKTTTTTLLGRMLEEAFGGMRIAGNIGIPLSEVITKKDKNPIAVELSSFQLETIKYFSPQTTVWLNISPNHLDWYHSYEDYIAAKARINKNNTDKTYVIFNEDDYVVKKWIQKSKGIKYSFSLNSEKANVFIQDEKIIVNIEKKIELISLKKLSLRGPHNLMNMMASSLAAFLNGIDIKIIRKVLQNFYGLEHRMEFVAKKNGVTYINDSKSTSVEALRMALQSFDRQVILIAGGKHKGGSYESLNELVREKAKFIALIGDSSQMMFDAWNGYVPVKKFGTLFRSLQEIKNRVTLGDIVLFSPACSSFDQFKSYEERGTCFKRFVNEEM